MAVVLRARELYLVPLCRNGLRLRTQVENTVGNGVISNGETISVLGILDQPCHTRVAR